MGEYADYFIEHEYGIDPNEGAGDPNERRWATIEQLRLAIDLAAANGMKLWLADAGHFKLSFECKRVAVTMSIFPETGKYAYDRSPQFKKRMYLGGTWNILDAVKAVIRATKRRDERKWVEATG